MGLLELKRLMSMQRQRRRRQIQARDGSVASRDKRKGSPCEQDCVADGSIASRYKRNGSPCQQDCSPQGASWDRRKGSPYEQDCVAGGSVASLADSKGSSYQQGDSSQSGKIKGYSGPNLPEDIWRHIHSLMSLRDAARTACVSRTFLCSWRRHPNLIFSKETLGLNKNASEKDEPARAFISKVDHILKNHSGIGVKTFKLRNAPDYSAKDRYYLDSWLQMAVTPGLEELTLSLDSKNDKYKFPCSLLSDGNGDSIRDLRLSCCAFRPTVVLGCLRSLTRLNLFMVRITGDDLGCLLFSSLALERLQLRYCCQINCVKIPCLLQRLSYLEVLTCSKLQVIESKAPNLSSFTFEGDLQVQLSLGEALQVKYLNMRCLGAVCYTRAELATSMPNLETLFIDSSREMVNTPMVSSKFLHLKYLSITLTGVTFSPSYDYCSLVSFFDASPSLETLFLDVSQRRMEHVSVFGDPSELRQLPEHKHDKLRNVKICGFSSAKSLVELACHILGSATSLERLTLDTKRHVVPGCSVNKVGKCMSMERDMILEAHRALCAVQVYIKPKVPSTVKLHVSGPCSRCHAVELTDRGMWTMVYFPTLMPMTGVSQQTPDPTPRQT